MRPGFRDSMRLPSAFVNEFAGLTLSMLMLREADSVQEPWTVSNRTHTDGRVDLDINRRAFVEECDVRAGDILLCRYRGHRRISVKVFGETACRRRLPSLSDEGEGDDW